MNVHASPEMPLPEAVERALTRDLAWLSEALGSPVARADPVSPLRGRGRPRTAYRVDLADGRRVKLRRVGEVEEAARLEALLSALAPVGLPRVLARRGRTFAIEWIPGRDLAAGDETPERLAEAGRLLGRIHATAGFAEERLPTRRPATAELSRCGYHLERLVEAGALGPSEAAELAADVRALVASWAEHGIAHGDFGGSNLVVDDAGALRIVDNEALHVGVLDLDLARVWSRWPLSEARWQGFLAAYRGASGRATQDRDLRGWKLRALVTSAWYRTTFELPGAEAAVARLRELAGRAG